MGGSRCPWPVPTASGSTSGATSSSSAAHLPQALRKGLEGTLRGAAPAWKIAPSSGDRPGLVLASTRAFPALQPAAAPKGAGLDALAIAQTPSEPTARACLAGCIELIQSGETGTPTGRKLFDALAEAVGVMHPQMARALATGVQLAARDNEESDFDKLRNRDCLKTVLEIDPITKQKIMECRKLTSGEIALAMSVFGTNIPYESVHVYRRKFWPIQGEYEIIAPDGDIYADRDDKVYFDDYSMTGFQQQAHFIHEMAHVWQVRTQNINLKSRRMVEWDYDYTIEPGKRFLEYQVEQQASIVADYFLFLKGQSPIRGGPMKNGMDLKGDAALDVYRRLLPFLNHIWT